MAAVFSRLPMRVRCATQRDHVFHPEMNYSQTQLDQLDRLTERWVADHLQKGKTSKKDKELVTLEDSLSHAFSKAFNRSLSRKIEPIPALVHSNVEIETAIIALGRDP